MKKLIVASVSFFVMTFSLLWAIPSLAVMWPAYENTTRHMGHVSELYSTTVGGQPWVAFDMTLPDGSNVRYDCDTRATALHCTDVHLGDTILVSGHSETYGGGRSCRWDGGDYLLVPNVLWNCTSGTCVQLTP